MADLPDTPPQPESSPDEEDLSMMSSLSVINRQEKNVDNENFITRQQEARSILETLKLVWLKQEDVGTVMAVMFRLARDTDTNVRVELINQVPHVAVFCRQRDIYLGSLVRQHLVPLLVDAFSDDMPSVRKSSHNAFLMLLEQNLVDRTLLEEWLCPLVAMQAVEESIEENRRLEALLLLCKVASLVGPELAEKFFLSHFLGLCSHHSPAIRKTCAIKMAEMCNVVGSSLVESQLLPKFLELCRDQEWEIRRCCAEDFMDISWVCQLSTRHQVLTPCFLELLSDTDYVKSAAYQSLGPFITTFVDPISLSPQPLSPTEEGDHSLLNLQRFPGFCIEPSKLPPTPNQPEEAFNAFQFWREPLPEVDPAMLVSRPNVCVVRPMRQMSAKEHFENSLDIFGACRKEWDMKDFNDGDKVKALRRSFRETPAMNKLSSSSSSPDDLELGRSPTRLFPYSSIEDLDEELGGSKVPAAVKQDVVPPLLLEHYIGMAAESGGLAGHCAYGLPAVALTLRYEGWGCLRGAWMALVGDVQWRVRRSLAAALHHLAVILGPHLAQTDLLPAFWIFLNDMDEVRSALLEHLHHFLRALCPEDRHAVLTHMSVFLKMDNRNNWRYRMALSHQLQNVADLFLWQDVRDYIIPLGLMLLKDRVFTVRQAATKLIALQLRRFYLKPAFETTVLQQLEEALHGSPKWTHRQTYVFLCEEIVEEQALPLERFASQVAPLVLRLAWDPVPNVRLAVARMLSRSLHLLTIRRHHPALLDSALAHLRGDTDRDVIHFIQLCPPTPL